MTDKKKAAHPRKDNAQPPVAAEPVPESTDQNPIASEEPPKGAEQLSSAPEPTEGAVEPTETVAESLQDDATPLKDALVSPPADIDATLIDAEISLSEIDIESNDAPTLAETALVPPPTDADTTLSDDTTVTDIDITLSDARRPRLGLEWWRTHKPDLSSVRSRLRRPAFRKWQLGVVIGLGALVLLFIVAVAVDGGLYYNEIHYGVKIAGQDVAGLGREEGTAALSAFVEEAREQPITLSSGDETWEVLPDDLGTTIDAAAAVSTAMDLTRDDNAFVDLGQRLKLYFSGQDIPLQGTVDSAKMDALVDELAAELDEQPMNARMIIIGNEIKVAEGEPGSVVDKDALRTQLTELLFSFHSTELQIPMVVVEPDIAAVDVSPALEDANTMISSDLVLAHGDLSWTFTPREIASYMDLTYKNVAGVNTLVPYLSAAKLSVFFDGIEPSVNVPGVNATMDSDGKTVWVVPQVDGQGLDREATADALTDAALTTSGRRGAVVLATMEPDLTTAEVEAMGIKDLLASYSTTPYNGSANRQHNVRLGTSLCSGVLMAPGEVFNTDEQLGTRDAAHGWKTAPGIVGFGELDDVYGGGICQVSTTLFNAVFEAGLEVVERHNHSIFINHYPDGRDATVTGGGKNMRFKNDTDHYIFIYGESTGVLTTFYVWGVSDGRTVTSTFSGFYGFKGHGTKTVLNGALAPGTTNVAFAGQTGKKCEVTRTITWPDGTTKTETFASSFPAIPSITEVGPAAPAPVTTGAPPTDTTPTTASAP